MLELKYTCRYCGRTAIIGKHRCLRERIAKLGRRPADSDADLRSDSSGPERKPTLYPWRIAAVTATVALIVLVSLTLLIAGFAWAPLLLAPIVFLMARSRSGKGRGAAYRRLLSLCHGDTALTDRLIAAELRRNGNQSRKAAVQGAMERLLSDRR